MVYVENDSAKWFIKTNGNMLYSVAQLIVKQIAALL